MTEIKPKFSYQSLQWQLIQASEYSELIEDYSDQLDCLQDSLNELMIDKTSIPQIVNDILYYINEYEILEKTIASEINVMRDRKARFEKKADNLRATIKMVFDKFQLTKMECPSGTVSKVIKKASKLNINDEGALLMNYPHLYIKQEPKLDKTALKSILVSGENVDGAELLDTETIMIRR